MLAHSHDSSQFWLSPEKGGGYVELAEEAAFVNACRCNIRLQLSFRKASSHSGIGCLLEGFSRRDRKGRTKKMATPEVRGVSGVAASKRRCGRSKEFRGEVDNPLTTKSEVFKQFFSHRHWNDPQRLRRDHVRPKACAVYEDQGDR